MSDKQAPVNPQDDKAPTEPTKETSAEGQASTGQNEAHKSNLSGDDKNVAEVNKAGDNTEPVASTSVHDA